MKRFKALLTRDNAVFAAIVAIVTIVYLFLGRNPAIRFRLEALSQDLIIWLTNLGLAGAFLVTFIANTSVVIQIPYPALFIFFASQADDVPFLFYLVIVGAAGSTLGEMISYSIGRGIGNTAIIGDGLSATIHNLVSERSHLVGLFVFFLAASPLPDDILLIPLGLSKYGLQRIVLPIFLGKGIVLGALVFITYNTKITVSEITGGSILDPTLIPLLVLLLLLFIIFQARQAREAQLSS